MADQDDRPDEGAPGAAFRPSREPTGEDEAAPRRSLEPESGGSSEFSRVEGEDDLSEVKLDLPDVRAELDEAERGGRYQDGPILGAGGMGEVRLRKDRRIGRSIAAKIMHSHVETPETRQRFLREARVQGQLEHPAIVPVYDLGVEDGKLFFTMKRVRGQTLARILFGLASGEEEYVKRFTRRRILAYFLQVCRAVHYAHVHGVLHRDLKPSNVMIGDYGEVYVLDWGLARTLEARPTATGASARARHSIVAADPTRMRMFRPNITKPGNLIGTLAYMSPEQARTEPLDARADVYSLGIILYEILALRRFRDDSSYLRVIAQIVDEVVARPSDVDVDIDPMLDALCVKATAVDLEERCETALEMAEAIERWLDGARDVESHKRSAAAAVKGAKERLAASDPETAGAALHDLLRAVTLDPENREAPKLLLDALEAPNAALPKEVDAEVAARRAERPKVGAYLAVASVLALATPPVLWLVGVHDLGVLGPVLAISLIMLGLMLFARAAYAAQIAKLDASDRRIAVQAYHLRQLFPGAIADDKRDRLSSG